jgi:GntR family transcriptional regulator
MACPPVGLSIQVTVNLTQQVGPMEGKMPNRDERHIAATAEDLRVEQAASRAVDEAVIDGGGMLPAYVQLAILLRAMIVTRQLPVGTMLPSEPELTSRYQVSRDTVRRAMQVIRDIGLAETRRGIGHFVSRTPEIRRVVLAPGSRVFVRMPRPDEQDEYLALLVYVVTEPGKPPVTYDTSRTLLVAPD